MPLNLEWDHESNENMNLSTNIVENDNVKGRETMKGLRHGKGNEESNNCVIIGDIKRSRDLDNWQNIFGKLKQTLEVINKKFPDAIIVTFAPTVGDEFQGAIRTPERALEIRNFVKRELPVDIYFGIGIGSIEKPIAKEIGLRGSAFYRARDALELCKKKKRDIFVKSSDTSQLADNAINTLLHLVEVLENSWTKRQREVAEYFRLHPNYTYEQLGKHFGLRKQSISDVLRAANWKVITEGNDLVQELLQELSSPEMQSSRRG